MKYYLKIMRINLIHLMPILKCPKNASDGGYAVSDYRKINEKVGTLEDVLDLAKNVRKKDILLALDIVVKYENHVVRVNDGKLLPMRSNQKMNKYLKTIAGKAKISKQLTFHMARHTFATTVTLTNGVPIETVSSMLGHTSIRTTQIYAKVIEKKVSEDMQTLKSVLTKKSTDELKKSG